MSAAHIPRFLLPRGPSLQYALRIQPCYPHPYAPPTTLHPHCRNASTKPSASKPRVLEKPSKFSPPSHPARLNRPPPRQYPGPPLSATEKEAQKTKQYPHMMPPQGSFMHWFLTDRTIHVWITLGTLFSLALYTFLSNFRNTSPFADLLPAANTFFAHPLSFISQYIEVYKLHTARISAETADRRRNKVDDVRKRGEYRKAHGLEKDESFGGWKAREVGEELGPALRVEGQGRGAGQAMMEVTAEDVEGRKGTEGEAEVEGVYADWEGRKKPVRKWLGIW